MHNHRSLRNAVLVAEIEFLEQNGVSDPEWQFAYRTCDVTGLYKPRRLGGFHLVFTWYFQVFLFIWNIF